MEIVVPQTGNQELATAIYQRRPLGQPLASGCNRDNLLSLYHDVGVCLRRTVGSVNDGYVRDSNGPLPKRRTDPYHSQNQRSAELSHHGDEYVESE